MKKIIFKFFQKIFYKEINLLIEEKKEVLRLEIKNNETKYNYQDKNNKIENSMFFKNNTYYYGEVINETPNGKYKEEILYYKNKSGIINEKNNILQKTKYLNDELQSISGYYPNGNLEFNVTKINLDKNIFNCIIFYSELGFIDKIVYIESKNLNNYLQYYRKLIDFKTDFKEYVYEFYPNGILKRKYVRENSKFIGEYLEFYNDGIKKIEKNYNKKGQLNGSIFTFYRNGLIKEMFNCLNGNNYGFLKRYYNNGQLKEIISNFEDKKNIRILEKNWMGETIINNLK